MGLLNLSLLVACVALVRSINPRVAPRTPFRLRTQCAALLQEQGPPPSERRMRAALEAGACLLGERECGLLSVLGDGRHRFLHQQSTNVIQGMGTYTVRETVITTSVGRIRDLVTVASIGGADGLLVLTSPGRASSLLKTLDVRCGPVA